MGAADECGDLNCDGTVDWRDVNPFVLVLSDRAEYEERYPECDARNGDCNGDERVDFGDINPFVALLGAGDGADLPSHHNRPLAPSRSVGLQ